MLSIADCCSGKDDGLPGATLRFFGGIIHTSTEGCSFLLLFELLLYVLKDVRRVNEEAISLVALTCCYCCYFERAARPSLTYLGS